MSRIDGNVTDFAPRASLGAHATLATCACWVCQSNLSTRAAFCHDCSTIQPVRDVDHFTRLGLDRRFDVDRDIMEGRYTALTRIYQAERQAAKGPRQKQLAGDHLSAVEEAYQSLRCPVRRAQYLLTLLDEPNVSAEQISGEMADLRQELTNAADTSAVERVAFKAVHGVELAIRALSTAFRQQSFTDVAVILARLAQLEDIAASARASRAAS